MSPMDQFINDLFDAALASLPLVSRRRMFGHDAFFANGAIFGLVWEGRAALKLPERSAYAEALAMAGAFPWKPMPAARSPMAHWVVMGEALHDDDAAFARWVAFAHRLAMDAPAAAPAPEVAARREVVFRAPTPTPPWKKALEKKRLAEAKKQPPATKRKSTAAPRKKPVKKAKAPRARK
jgi:TfoX/Sxy family transcriptional regulator of competence genes